MSASPGISDCKSTLTCNSRCHFGEDVGRGKLHKQGEIFPYLCFIFSFFSELYELYPELYYINKGLGPQKSSHHVNKIDITK